MFKKVLKYVFFFGVIIIIFGALGDKENKKNNSVQNVVKETAVDTKMDSTTRSFYMGLGSWPPDATVEAVNAMYDVIDAHTDMVFHHFDNGIPWQEALDGRAFPKHLEGDWNWKKVKTKADKKIYLGITPLNFDRDGMVGYWGEKDNNEPLPDNWKNLRFNDPKVKTAYVNYVRRAVEYFNPTYLSIGSEVNILAAKDRGAWGDYLELNQYVYTELKKQYPTLPIFVSLQYEWLRGAEKETQNKKAEQVTDAKDVLKSSDIIALTVYKYGTIHNPIVGDYFALAKSLAQKPIGLAEIGAMSKEAKFNGITFTANEEDQDTFIRFMVSEASKGKFVFVNNYFPIDFDKLLKRLPKELQGVSVTWAHMGLYDMDLKPKKALRTWDMYLQLPVAQ
ncbi:MAG: hypothetical protein QG653_389 [Patescibacteria group bacterium]|nr:hypothetical protein [Patescibacteria group bacterium]